MKTYEISYWSEGPGRSGTDRVLVLAKNAKEAVDLVIKECAVYKQDQPYVKATLVDGEKYKKRNYN